MKFRPISLSKLYADTLTKQTACVMIDVIPVICSFAITRKGSSGSWVVIRVSLANCGSDTAW